MQKSNVQLLIRQFELFYDKIEIKLYEIENIRFQYIIELDEVGKNLTRTDDMMRRWVLIKNENIPLNLYQICDLLVTFNNQIPLWIKVDIKQIKEKIVVFRIGQRFRRLYDVKAWHHGNDFFPYLI